MRIGLVTASDARSRESWSGTYYYMAQALQKHCGDVSYLGPINTIALYAAGGVGKGFELLFRKRYWHARSIVVAKRYARILEHRIAKQRLDLLVAPLALAEISYLKTEISIVYVCDSAFASVVNYYPTYSDSDLFGISIREGNILEGRALRRANLVLYPSKWAAEAAIADYHVDRAKVHVVPFGANLEDVPDEETVMGKKQSDRCRLLFLGKYWERKGGDKVTPHPGIATSSVRDGLLAITTAGSLGGDENAEGLRPSAHPISDNLLLPNPGDHVLGFSPAEARIADLPGSVQPGLTSGQLEVRHGYSHVHQL